MKTSVLFLISVLATAVVPGANAQPWGGVHAVRVAAPASSFSSEGYRHSRSEYDFAEVIAVRPIVRIVTVRVPRRECWSEEVFVEHRRRGGTAGATIAGGLLGGVVGRQIGGGSGRDAMTLVGAIVGSAIGTERALAREGGADGHFETIQRCETREEIREEERIDGYDAGSTIPVPVTTRDRACACASPWRRRVVSRDSKRRRG